MRPIHPALQRAARPLLALAVFAALAAPALADTLNVVSSGGFAAAYKQLVQQYEKDPGHQVHSDWGPSMGKTANAIPQRLARNEPIDVVIMVGDALDKLMATGQLVPGSKVQLADSTIACAVPHGRPHPDIHTVDGLKSALLAARSVAWSDSASGEYIEKQLLPRLGIAEQMQGKGRKIPATPVGEIVAKGEADFGCQQRSELLPVAGIDLVGDLPAEVQSVTEFSAAVVATSTHKDEARRFLAFLAAPQNAAVIRDTGLVPRTNAPKQ
ncbi:MAG: substrate-binding domain-containing protein [Ramlibacter sp.]